MNESTTYKGTTHLTGHVNDDAVLTSVSPTS